MTFNRVVIIEGALTGIAIKECNLFCGPMRLGDIEIFEEKLVASKVDYVLAQVETIIPRRDIKGKAMMYRKGYCIFVNSADTMSGVNLKEIQVSNYYEEYMVSLDGNLKFEYNDSCRLTLTSVLAPLKRSRFKG